MTEPYQINSHAMAEFLRTHRGGATTWVNDNYQIRQWNYYKVDGPRTNNHVEGWHSRLKKVVGKAHPNIYELVEVIKSEDSIAAMKIGQLTAGATQAPRRRKIRVKKQRFVTPLI